MKPGRTLTREYTKAHDALTFVAFANDIGVNEMRVLMSIVDNSDEIGEVDSAQIEAATHMHPSNIRRSLYALDAAGMIGFAHKRRGERLRVFQTALGLSIAQEAALLWANPQYVSA